MARTSELDSVKYARGDHAYWIGVFADDYLTTAKDEFDAEDSIDEVIQRAIESLESELRSQLRDVVREWADQECEACLGSGLYTNEDDSETDCEACKGTGRTFE